MRPDFRSILLILNKAIKLACKKQFSNESFQWSGIRIFESIEAFKTALNGFSLVIVGDGGQIPHLTTLPTDICRYLIQIGASSSVEIRLDSYFPLLGVLFFPLYFDLGFVPSVLNIELDRSQGFDRKFNPAII